MEKQLKTKDLAKKFPHSSKNKLRRKLHLTPKFNPKIALLAIIFFAGIGLYFLYISRASDEPVPATKPYVKLFSQGNGSVSGDPTATAANLSKYFSHIHGEGSDPNSFVIKKTGLGSKLIAN